MQRNFFSISFVIFSALLVASLWSSVAVSQVQTSSEKKSLSFSNAEFTDLLIRSLRNDPNGALLLSVSDSISAEINEANLSLSAVINLNKLEKISPEARQTIENFNGFLFFLDREKLNLTVIGEPEVRNGLVGIRDNFSIELGPLPIANSVLRQFGVQVEQANVTNLKLENIVAQSIKIQEGLLVLNVGSENQ